jgi:hypothetical protein
VAVLRVFLLARILQLAVSYLSLACALPSIHAQGQADSVAGFGTVKDAVWWSPECIFGGCFSFAAFGIGSYMTRHPSEG